MSDGRNDPCSECKAQNTMHGPSSRELVGLPTIFKIGTCSALLLRPNWLMRPAGSSGVSTLNTWRKLCLLEENYWGSRSCSHWSQHSRFPFIYNHLQQKKRRSCKAMAQRHPLRHPGYSRRSHWPRSTRELQTDQREGSWTFPLLFVLDL